MLLSKRQITIVAVIAAVIGAATYVVVNAAKRTYQADTTIIVPSQNGNFNSDAVTAIPQPALLPADYVTVATSAPVLTTALKRRGVANPSQMQLDALRKQITVTNGPPSAANTSSNSSDSVSIAASADTESGASELANQVTQGLLAWDSHRLRNRVRTLLTVAQAAAIGRTTRSVRNRADSMIAALKLTSLKSALSVVAPADPPTTPVAPHPLRDAVLAFLAAGILLSGALVYRRRSPGIAAPRHPPEREAVASS